MRYYLSIDKKVFENVSDIKVNKEYRSESSFKNLGGNILIDRIGDEKTDLKVKINMLSADDMQFLRNCRAKMNVAVQYYEGNILAEKNMYIEPFTEPAPIYHYGDRTKGLTYGTLTLNLTEL